METLPGPLLSPGRNVTTQPPTVLPDVLRPDVFWKVTQENERQAARHSNGKFSISPPSKSHPRRTRVQETQLLRDLGRTSTPSGPGGLYLGVSMRSLDPLTTWTGLPVGTEATGAPKYELNRTFNTPQNKRKKKREKLIRKT